MTIDISKIKPGDTVTLGGRFKVKGCGGISVCISVPDACDLLVPTAMIASHEPAKREFKVGDKVRFKLGVHTYNVRAIDGEWLMLQVIRSYGPGYRTVYHASDCEHVGETE